MKYVKPELNKSAFHCPLCNTYSQQIWGNIMEDANSKGRGSRKLENWKGALCDHCNEIALWNGSQLIFPDSPSIIPPNEDLEESIKKDYIEASQIIEKSPKSAAALMRLAIQKLCKHLGENGENINEDIGNLVKKGLPIQIQQALDVVRVIGNESVHPDQINLDDNKEIAYKLFELLNIIAQTMITQPKEISELYSKLPQTKLEEISKRDA